MKLTNDLFDRILNCLNIPAFFTEASILSLFFVSIICYTCFKPLSELSNLSKNFSSTSVPLVNATSIAWSNGLTSSGQDYPNDS